MAARLSWNAPVPPPLPLHRFTVQQYHRLGELGLLTPEDNVELLEGWIVEKMNQRPVHGFIVGLLNEWFQQRLPDGFVVRCQLPMTTERSEPEPDLAVLKGEHSNFRRQHPRGSDCRLIIEVADTSLEKDRAKASIYAEAGVEEYWIVNVEAKRIERYQFKQSEGSDPACSLVTERISVACGSATVDLDLRPLF